MRYNEVQINIINTLESLVSKRFKNIKELKKTLNWLFPNYKISLNYRNMDGIDGGIDFNIIGTLENDLLEILCDIDIYYAKTRAKEMYITEVGYEFE